MKYRVNWNSNDYLLDLNYDDENKNMTERKKDKNLNYEVVCVRNLGTFEAAIMMMSKRPLKLVVNFRGSGATKPIYSFAEATIGNQCPRLLYTHRVVLRLGRVHGIL